MTARPLHRTARRHRQRGVYAVEYALVFLVFFGLIYTSICYGVIVAFRLGLQNAAEDGARAALRYQVNLDARLAKAEEVARARTQGWLPMTPEVTRFVAYSTGSTCGLTLDERCQVVVRVTASGLAQVLPPFPRFALPSSVTGQARVILDGRSL